MVVRPNFNWEDWLYETADIDDRIHVCINEKLYACKIIGFTVPGPWLPIVSPENYGGKFDIEDKGENRKWGAIVLTIRDLERNAVYNESIMNNK